MMTNQIDDTAQRQRQLLTVRLKPAHNLRVRLASSHRTVRTGRTVTISDVISDLIERHLEPAEGEDASLEQNA